MKLPSIVKCAFTGRWFENLKYYCWSTCGQFVKVILNCTLHRCIACCLGYARCATIYWFDMELLKHRCPNECKEFAARDFSFLKTIKQSSRMALDQLHEQNSNYIKSVSGATSLINRQDDSGLVRWELCGPELCRIIEEFEEVESSTTHEKSKSTMKTTLHLRRISLRTPPHYLIISQITRSYSMALPWSSTQIWYLKATFIATWSNC